MRWIVGIDARARTAGAIRTAAWMAAHGDATRLFGVHVVPKAPRVAERDDVIDDLCAKARAQADDALRSLGAAEAFERIEAVPGAAAEISLAAAAEYYDADGIIVGRAATERETAIVRLGAVARRLLRSLPRAMMIVPPDHDPRGRDGPVVLATDLQADAGMAGRYAGQVARELGRELVAVHVVPDSPFPFGPEAPRPTRDAIAGRFEDWLAQYEIGGTAAHRRDGDAIEELLEDERTRHAAMLVVGSRRLSTLDRVFQSSTGTELSRYATCPVLVVPP